VLEEADGDTSSPNVSDQDDRTNTRVLAAAIVFARTGDEPYRDRVVEACEAAIGTEAGGRTLAWGREVGAYAMAADLVGFRTPAFEGWLRDVADVLVGDDGRTLREMFEARPNNWGAMAFGSLTAIYRYLGDDASLAAVRGFLVEGIEGPDPGFSWGDDMSWHADPDDPRLINPAGATLRDGDREVTVDGIIPDDMRRGGSFAADPGYTNYPWGWLAGVVMGARVLERAGMPIWEAGDDALFRAAYAQEERLAGAWRCEGDDLWLLPFFDAAYGTTWSEGRDDVWGTGKNAGFGYVLGD
jgi:hypothetical protein